MVASVGVGVAGGDQVEKSQQWPGHKLSRGKGRARGWTERYHLQAPSHLGNGVTVMAPPRLGAVSHRSPGEGPGVPQAKAGTTG